MKLFRPSGEYISRGIHTKSAIIAKRLLAFCRRIGFLVAIIPLVFSPSIAPFWQLFMECISIYSPLDSDPRSNRSGSSMQILSFSSSFSPRPFLLPEFGLIRAKWRQSFLRPAAGPMNNADSM